MKGMLCPHLNWDLSQPQNNRAFAIDRWITLAGNGEVDYVHWCLVLPHSQKCSPGIEFLIWRCQLHYHHHSVAAVSIHLTQIQKGLHVHIAVQYINNCLYALFFFSIKSLQITFIHFIMQLYVLYKDKWITFHSYHVLFDFHYPPETECLLIGSFWK